MVVVFFYLFVGICAVVYYTQRGTRNVGVIVTKKGNKYPYTIGNYLTSETSKFNGVEVILPYTLANFYLDSHKDSKKHGPAALFDASQKVSLEGDFNKHFQLFVPPSNATFVLSVLSPDVMHTLMTSSDRYDVQLSGNKLRIITLHSIGTISGQPLVHAA